MKKTMKRIATVVLALCLVLSCVPAASAAAHPFTDVPDGQWYSEPVEYVYTNGIMSGVAADKFSPNTNMSRAMMVTVLYRIAGCPGISGEFGNPFTDVPENQWFTDAVLWALDASITAGTSATTFSPHENVTREQLVTFFYRYAPSVGQAMTTTKINGYADYCQVDEYARTPFAWAVASGIITGTGNNKLSPNDCATMIQRFFNWKDGNATVNPPEETTPEQTPVEPKYDIAEAMSVGNTYAAEIGFTVAEIDIEEAGYRFPDVITQGGLDYSGRGQERLNELAKSAIDVLADDVRGRYGENEDLSLWQVWCYIEYVACEDTYYIYALYC